jgi:hypothetical protein
MARSIQSVEPNQSVEPYHMEFLRCAQCLHEFEYKNRLYHPITLPMCGHTMCKGCIGSICNRTQCPKDSVSFGKNHTPIDQLPTNYALLTLICNPLEVNI